MRQESIPHRITLIGPSDQHRFVEEELPAGTAYRLNIFSESNDDQWSERERVEFSVKSQLFLSKLVRRESFDCIVIADCDGIEPLLVGLLSPMAPIWVLTPDRINSKRGELSYALMELAAQEFDSGELGLIPGNWPPDQIFVNTLINTIFD